MNKTLAKKQLNKLLDITTLSPEQVRVEVAKDVIAAVTLNKVELAQDTYCSMSFNQTLPPGTHNLREEISSMASCRVCAIGSVLMAFVSRFNQFKFDLGYDSYDVGINSINIINALKPHFVYEQLSLMELAFGDFTLLDQPHSVSTRERARAFFNSFGEYQSKERLIAIMQNIVDNNGTFTL